MPVIEMTRLTTCDPRAIASKLDGWKKTAPEMGVFAMLPEGEKNVLAEIQALFRHQNIPLAGAIFPALIEDEHFHTEGMLLICFDVMPQFLLQTELNHEGEELDSACEQLADEIGGLMKDDSDNTTLFMIFDAMLPRIGLILENLYQQLADRVHYMGVNAGSETFSPMPCLFDSEQIIEQGMLAILLDNHDGAILEHGYRVPGEMVAATSTEGNRIISIDWRPAFEVYAERIREQYQVEITKENFYEYAVHFPFGIIRADDEILVRIPVALMDDGSLFCVGEIPANAVLTLLSAPTPDSSETVANLANGLPATLSNIGLLFFYCAGRRMHLGVEAAEGELAKMREQRSNEHLYGALSLGEIGSSHRGGYPLFHNATLIAAEI